MSRTRITCTDGSTTRFYENGRLTDRIVHHPEHNSFQVYQGLTEAGEQFTTVAILSNANPSLGDPQ